MSERFSTQYTEETRRRSVPPHAMGRFFSPSACRTAPLKRAKNSSGSAAVVWKQRSANRASRSSSRPLPAT